MSWRASNSPGAKALRAAGYIKSPSLWVTQEQFELIQYMTRANLPDVNRIKDEAYGRETPNDNAGYARDGEE